MARLRLFLLGPPRLERDGASLEFDTRKIMALVAYLAMTGQGREGASHRREELVTLLWPELEPSRARATLRRNLSVLRKALDGDWLITDRQTVGTDPGADFWLDVEQFRRLLAAWQQHGHAEGEVCLECLGALAKAIELYQGDFLAGFSLRDSITFDEWQFFETESLRQELATALERLVRGHTAQGTYEAAIPYARRWLALDPLHEPAHAYLMQLYASSGQRAAALRQYADYVRILDGELGLPPSGEITALYEQIRTSPDFRVGRLAPVTQPRHNLPTQLTPFVGRVEELAEIRTRLGEPDCRLLTLIGPGGIGKTRLAVQVAADLAESQPDRYAHGIYFVRLASLQSPDAVVAAVADALGFCFIGNTDRGETAKPRQQLLDYLRQKQMLLVMDNYEHLLVEAGSDSGNGAAVVADILAAAPDLTILATSRASLRVQGEHLYPVSGMRFPAPGLTATREPAAGVKTAPDPSGYSAVQLFLQAARRVRPDFEPPSRDLEQVVRICRLVQGMPLGILLAAAWVDTLSLEEIATELDRSLDLLETDLRDVPDRQRSIRAVFAHSWRLLTEREREVFRAASIFRGGFAREAANVVAGASLLELRALVNKSLLHVMRVPSQRLRTGPSPQLGTGGRYEVHELLRQCAAEELGRIPAVEESVRDRHCAYFSAALEQWALDLKGERQQVTLAEMDLEIENARAAWNWSVAQGQVAQLDQALEGLQLYYVWRSRYAEAESACRAAVERLEAMTSADARRVWARLVAIWSYFRVETKQMDAASQLVLQSLDVLEELEATGHDVRSEKALALFHMARWTFYTDPAGSTPWYEQSLALYESLDDRWGMARAVASLGWVAENLGHYDEAQALSERSLAIRQELGDQRGIADSLLDLGLLNWVQGYLEEAEDLFRRCLAIYREIGDWARTAYAIKNVGEALVRQGRFAEGLSLLEEGIEIFKDMGYRHGVSWVTPFLGEANAHLGRYEQSREDGRMALAVSREVSRWWNLAFSQLVRSLPELAAGAYREAQDMLQESEAMFRELEHRENLGWVLGPLGLADRGLGQLSEARQHVAEAMQIAAGLGAFMPFLYALPAAALLLSDRGQQVRAVELYALGSRYGFVANSRWFQDVAGRQITAVAATMPEDVVEAARRRGRTQDWRAEAARLPGELGE